MKTAILYATKHGCTEKCARELVNYLQSDTQIIKVDEIQDTNLDEFDQFILGGSIHAGALNRGFKKIIKEPLAPWTKKIIGLYVCCMHLGEQAEKQFNEAFPKALRKQAIAKGLFGGELLLEKMNFIERKIIKKIAKIDKSVSNINEDEIRKFANRINAHNQ